MKNKTYSIIIPTRNRTNLLTNLLEHIDMKDKSLLEIIIIDSSDYEISKQLFFRNKKIKYFHTAIKSASIQRNIGIEKLNKSSKYVFFLDDDVIPSSTYFQELINDLVLNKAIGASGIALGLNNKKRKKGWLINLSDLVKRLFLLDSKIDGKLLKSGVNIPVRTNKQTEKYIQEVDWLIGCSAWEKNIILKIKFPTNFYGQSLGEDVLFSALANKHGKLIVDPNIVLIHLESSIMRPDDLDHFKMWVHNRYIISTKLNLSRYNLMYHWCNFGKVVQLILLIPLNLKQNFSSLKGILYGYISIWRINEG